MKTPIVRFVFLMPSVIFVNASTHVHTSKLEHATLTAQLRQQMCQT